MPLDAVILVTWFIFLGASAGMKLRLFGVAIKWCDEGLTVSFDFKTFSACLCIDTQYQYHN